MITCIAIDDEPLALDLLEDNISKIPYLKLVKRCLSPMEANEVLRNQTIDLMFVDIQMPGLTGIQFLQGFSKHPPLVIFITAYEKFAIEGFNLDVVDYLLKPVAFERFLKAVNKAHDKLNARPSIAAPSRDVDYIFVNADYNLIKIKLSDIVYVEGLKDYVKIFLKDAIRPVITRMSMKGMEEKLPAIQFVRVHKSYIVSIDKILSIRKSRITLPNGHVPISDSYSDNLNKILNI